jgi:hypothetical protein
MDHLHRQRGKCGFPGELLHPYNCDFADVLCGSCSALVRGFPGGADLVPDEFQPPFIPLLPASCVPGFSGHRLRLPDCNRDSGIRFFISHSRSAATSKSLVLSSLLRTRGSGFSSCKGDLPTADLRGRSD